MRFGIHVPKQRSLTATAEYARDIGCETMQIASKCGLGQSRGNVFLSIVEHFREEIMGRAVAAV